LSRPRRALLARRFRSGVAGVVQALRAALCASASPAAGAAQRPLLRLFLALRLGLARGDRRLAGRRFFLFLLLATRRRALAQDFRIEVLLVLLRDLRLGLRGLRPAASATDRASSPAPLPAVSSTCGHFRQDFRRVIRPLLFAARSSPTSRFT
jgi:hypothetical protein